MALRRLQLRDTRFRSPENTSGHELAQTTRLEKLNQASCPPRKRKNIVHNVQFPGSRFGGFPIKTRSWDPYLGFQAVASAVICNRCAGAGISLPFAG